MGNIKAAFLDADGVLNTAMVINGKPAAPTTVADLVIPETIKPALDKLKAAGYFLVCVTNKPDVERGLMTQEAVDEIYAEIRRQLPLDDLYICYHEDAPCFKPKPGMLMEAAKKHDIDLSASIMVGDRKSDVEAGQNAGCKTVWINRNYPVNPQPEPPADYTAESLADAVDWILGDK